MLDPVPGAASRTVDQTLPPFKRGRDPALLRIPLGQPLRESITI
jgi:hypothetical protein